MARVGPWLVAAGIGITGCTVLACAIALVASIANHVSLIEVLHG